MVFPKKSAEWDYMGQERSDADGDIDPLTWPGGRTQEAPAEARGAWTERGASGGASRIDPLRGDARAADPEALGERVVFRLWADGLVNAKAIEQARRDADDRTRLDQALVRLGLCDATEAAKALALELDLPYADDAAFPESAVAAELLPARFVAEALAAPLEDDGEVLRLALADPLDDYSLRAIAMKTKRKLEICVSCAELLREEITRLYGAAAVHGGAHAPAQPREEPVRVTRSANADRSQRPETYAADDYDGGDADFGAEVGYDADYDAEYDADLADHDADVADHRDARDRRGSGEDREHHAARRGYDDDDDFDHDPDPDFDSDPALDDDRWLDAESDAEHDNEALDEAAEGRRGAPRFVRPRRVRLKETLRSAGPDDWRGPALTGARMRSSHADGSRNLRAERVSRAAAAERLMRVSAAEESGEWRRRAAERPRVFGAGAASGLIGDGEAPASFRDAEGGGRRRFIGAGLGGSGLGGSGFGGSDLAAGPTGAVSRAQRIGGALDGDGFDRDGFDRDGLERPDVGFEGVRVVGGAAAARARGAALRSADADADTGGAVAESAFTAAKAREQTRAARRLVMDQVRRALSDAGAGASAEDRFRAAAMASGSAAPASANPVRQAADALHQRETARGGDVGSLVRHALVGGDAPADAGSSRLASPSEPAASRPARRAAPDPSKQRLAAAPPAVPMPRERPGAHAPVEVAPSVAPPPGADLDAMSVSAAARSAFNRALTSDAGLVIVCGPAGAGKTATLGALAEAAAAAGRDVAALDPAWRPRATDGESAQGPILTGQIVDAESAEAAARAAMKGALVIVTLDAPSAAAAPPRLIEMGVPPYVVASCLKLVAAQYLAPRLGEDGAATPVAITEALTLDDAMRALVLSRAPAAAFRHAMKAAKAPSLADDAADKVEAGLVDEGDAARAADAALTS